MNRLCRAFLGERGWLNARGGPMVARLPTETGEPEGSARQVIEQGEGVVRHAGAFDERFQGAVVNPGDLLIVAAMVMPLQDGDHLFRCLQNLADLWGIVRAVGRRGVETLVNEDRRRQRRLGKIRFEPIELRSGNVGIGPPIVLSPIGVPSLRKQASSSTKCWPAWSNE